MGNNTRGKTIQNETLFFLFFFRQELSLLPHEESQSHGDCQRATVSNALGRFHDKGHGLFKESKHAHCMWMHCWSYSGGKWRVKASINLHKVKISIREAIPATSREAAYTQERGISSSQGQERTGHLEKLLTFHVQSPRVFSINQKT